MQNQIFTYGCLGFQCLLYCTDSQVGGKVPIRNAGNMLSFQENLHAAVTIHTVMLVVYRGDFLEHTLFLGTISRLPVFQEVVVGIGANVEFTQQPAHTKFMMMFLDEPISL